MKETQWQCMGCGRRFGRTNQSHECVPGMTLGEYLAGQPEERHATYRRVLEILSSFEGVNIDPVDVGIMVKRRRTFCEMRPRRNAVSLCFLLSQNITHPRFHRKVRCSAHRMAYFVNLVSEHEVDEQIATWLAEAHLDSAP